MISYNDFDSFCKGESDKNVLYINTDHFDITLDVLQSMIKNHFGHTDVTIEASECQFRCYGYDLHDWNDWGRCLVVASNESKK